MKACSLFLLFVLVVPQPSLAEAPVNTDTVPSKETVTQSLLPYWEQTLKQDPSTTLFEKSSAPGVYNIETTVIPYKGRIKVLNIIVDIYKPIGEYDKHIAYGGVVETELLDAPKNIAEIQPFSFKRWQRMGWFDYDTKTSHWFSFNTWDLHFPPSERRMNRACSKPTAPSSQDARMPSC